MSEDIRVYWDEDFCLYSICIDGKVISQSDLTSYQCLCDIDERDLCNDVLVYDSEHDITAIGVLRYVTNLEEENERLKKELDDMRVKYNAILRK